MSIPVALLAMFGKPLADKLWKGLLDKKDGAQKLEQAGAAMAQGLTAIDALKKFFGKDFLTLMNDAFGTAIHSAFTYESGTQDYIRVERPDAPPEEWLRDELNINLDRLTVLQGHADARRNHFLGLMKIWQARVRSCFPAQGNPKRNDIDETFATINGLLDGETRNYRQIYQMISRTGLGGIGALMLISGVFVATGTGVGVVSAISLFIFGIPWVAVGALVLPGALLITLVAKKSRPADQLSLATGLAYRLLERLSTAR